MEVLNVANMHLDKLKTHKNLTKVFNKLMWRPETTNKKTGRNRKAKCLINLFIIYSLQFALVKKRTHKLAL